MLRETFTGTRKESGMHSGTEAHQRAALVLPGLDRVSRRIGVRDRYCPLPGIAMLRRRQAAWNPSRAAAWTAVGSVEPSSLRTRMLPAARLPRLPTYLSRIAVMPMPPAVQIEISPRPLPRREQLGQRREDSRAGRGERMTEGDAAALDVELGCDRSSPAAREAEPVAAVFGRLPRLERAQHLRRERLVNLVEIEVLQLQPARRACAAPRTPAPSAGLPWDEVDRRVLAVVRYASTGKPRAFAHSSLASSTADAPSVSGVELPAVSVPACRTRA